MDKFEIEDDNAPLGHNDRRPKSLSYRKLFRTIASACLFIVTFKLIWSALFQRFLPTTSPSSFYLRHGKFESFPLIGFVNTGAIGNTVCNEILYGNDVQIQQSYRLEADIHNVAYQVKDHPLVMHEERTLGLTYEAMTEQCWTKGAGSSVWLEKHQVYLLVSQFIFHKPNAKDQSIISFLKGQVFDADWVELKDRTIQWQGEDITFPTIFNVSTPYRIEGGFYGPQDPQIIVEENLADAEPVVLFGMMSNLNNPERLLHVFRPFTNELVILGLDGQALRTIAGKMWSPFFYRAEKSSNLLQKTWPTRFIHLIESYTPLKVLKCELRGGYCDRVYEQDIPEDLVPKHNNSITTVSSGTNLVPIPLNRAVGVKSYVGFVRNQIEAGCAEGTMSTPQMIVLTASSSSHFHLDFVSEPVDFAPALLSPEALADPCGKGRSMAPISVSRWDRTSRQDVMTVSLSVDGPTLEALRVHGILSFLNQIPFLQQSLKQPIGAESSAVLDLTWSAAGSEALSCALEAAQDYSVELARSASGPYPLGQVVDP